MKKIRTLVFFVIIVLIIGWAYSSQPEQTSVPSETSTSTDSSAGETGVVAVGKTVLINGVNVTLNSVIRDSRCPIDVQCIQAGAINTNVTFESVSGDTLTNKETRNMPSDEVPMPFDLYKISIEAINPPRLSGRETSQSEYLVTFKVVKNQ